MAITLHPKHVYTVDVPVGKEEFFERMSKACYSIDKAKELGLLGIGNIRHAYVFKRDGDLFEIVKIVPREYKRQDYMVKGKGRVTSRDNEQQISVTIDYKMSDPGSALGFWVSFLVMFGLLDWSIYKIGAGHYHVQGVDFLFLIPLALLFFYRMSWAGEMKEFNNEIFGLLKQSAENQFPDENHISAKG